MHIKNKVKYLLAVLLICISNANLQAQCAMCRASLESSGNNAQAEAVNDGIVYLMVIPYVLVGIVGFLIYRMYSGKKENSDN
jgi:heme/copper-type cytochrome/quinol oxidase subunit 2